MGFPTTIWLKAFSAHLSPTTYKWLFFSENLVVGLVDIFCSAMQGTAVMLGECTLRIEVFN